MNKKKSMYNSLHEDLELYFDRLWPICRSITGKGYRDSLKILKELIPLESIKFKSGDKVYDWVIPKEWNINEAYFKDSMGKKYADFQSNNLHILNYSVPYKGKVSLNELKEHIHTIPELPNAIPYLTSYYDDRWGFCMSQNDFDNLKSSDYEVFIDANKSDGFLEIGECLLKGETDKEIFFSSYLCHPSLANNELSGPLVLSFLYRQIKKIKKRKYSYRFVILPETIGSIAYLSKMGQHLKEKIVAGYQITCVGDEGTLTYKSSRAKDTLSDRAAKCVLSKHEVKFKEFDPSVGSDERQYCSPGFDLPIGSLMRTMYTEYPEYHTSLDNKDLMNFKSMSEVISIYLEIVNLIESNNTYLNLFPYGEPQLGRRGLFRTLGAQRNRDEIEKAMWWALNYSDGNNDIIDISNLSLIQWQSVDEICTKLLKNNILKIKN